MKDSAMKFISNAARADLSSAQSLVTGLVVGIIALALYYRYKFSFLSRYGIKTPPPKWFVGNGLSMLGKDRLQNEVEWPKKYGKVYGIFMGSKPRVVVNDAELLRRISIKDFHLFPNHSEFPFGEKFEKKYVFNLNDGDWKRVRSIMSPTFTSGRMKKMHSQMKNCCTELQQVFEEQMRASPEQVVDPKQVYNLYSMDVIVSCGYGVKLKRTNGVTNPKSTRDSFVQAAFEIVEANIPRLIITLLIPEFILKAINFNVSPPSALNDFYSRTKSIVESRKLANAAGTKYDDLLQLLLDVELNEELDVNSVDAKESHHVGLSDIKSMQDEHRRLTRQVRDGESKKLTDGEVVANAMFMLFVGYETTSTLLVHATYLLAHHRDVQDRLFDELQQIRESDGSFTYDKVSSAPYLDAVICESLRAMPPVIALDRVTAADYPITELGITIPKNTPIDLAYYSILHNEEYWPEPGKFDPNRFMPEQRAKIVPGSYCPFGLGPRHCIGMRFALTEAKTAIAQLLSRFQLSPAPNTVYPPEPARSLFLARYENLDIKMTIR